jgi:glutamate dehydrogenase
VADIVERLRALARERRPGDAAFESFVGRYFREVPDDEVDELRREQAYAAAEAHLRLGRRRVRGQTIVELISPEADRDGWDLDRSILLFVTDDAPFLVDSVRMVLDRHRLGIHLLVHPTLHVRRSADGELVDVVAGHQSGEPDVVDEAWTLVELDRTATERSAQVVADVRRAIDEVQLVVADFEPMRDRLVARVGDDALLAWLADANFVFLGAHSRPSADTASADGGARDDALGVCRPGGSFDDLDDPDGVVWAPGQRVVLARTRAVATVHRPVRMTSIVVRDDGVEHRFVGLLGSSAYRQSVFSIPAIGERAAAVVATIGASVDSHTGRAVRNVIETLPRDLVFESAVDDLVGLVGAIVGLQERRIVRVFDLPEPVGSWTTVLAYVPLARFTALLTEIVAGIVSEHAGAPVRDVESLVGSSSLARISMTVEARTRIDHERLVDAIDDASLTWDERAAGALVDAVGEREAQHVWTLVGPTVPAAYRARVAASQASDTLVTVASMFAGDRTIATAFEPTPDSETWNFRVYLRDRAATLAELVPVLEHLGLAPVEEYPAVFAGSDSTVYVDDLVVAAPPVVPSADVIAEVQQAFVDLMGGAVEADRLNRLVLSAGLDCRQVAVLRLYRRYLHQASFPFSADYVERAIVRHPDIARGLVAVFDARFDPDRFADSPDDRDAAVGEARAAVVEMLDEVPSLDDDRICRAVLTVIDATVRTNAFRGGAEIAVKLEPSQISFVPHPRPRFEIFVCSPWVEGVHLRGGRIARGGLRWSDRAEDFRTEVLGLVKAQMVKNAVIVPTGAKGGFVVKSPTADPGDRDAIRAEGVDRYQRFVGSLLDVTDNVVDGEVVHPDRVVVHDGADPYLVVAADKGTATFSDIANELAVARGFWLGDAFASGGSQGYDHKAMGITARGAWESVRRHARVLGLDADRDELTAVGIGDMSGDVFGNGMLLSPHLRLVAAFDHRHVFLDPDPDPARAHAERKRLFDLPRSSWADYDTGLISPGGGVHGRDLKVIPITDEVRSALDLADDVDELRPDALISAILRAPVDLLWNGGIGTYVKSASESHADVGDRANDAVRVDGGDVRARIVGEGGNLGLTQSGRIEYALTGGLIFTDAIDNSAGVDCSDHEVNLKILLDEAVRADAMSVEERNGVLAGMTDDVAELVLDNNRAQTLALVIARRQSLPMVNVHARYLDTLEAEGYLDRALEFLPTDKQIAERQASGGGLSAPEFAVLIAYTKNANVTEILESDLPDDPALNDDLVRYFPEAIRERFADGIDAHRLRREIIATVVVNEMVNLAGISFDHRMTEDSGASITDVTRAFVAARDIFGFRDLWAEIDALGRTVELGTQVELFLDARRMTERGTTWLLRHRRPPLDIAHAIEVFSPGIAFLAESLDGVVSGRVAADVERDRAERIAASVPPDLAARSARWPWMHTGFDIVEVAHSEACNIADAAAAYWQVFDEFDVQWLWDGIGALPRSDRWQQQARSALRDDLMSALADLTRSVMRTGGGSPAAWIRANDRAVSRALAMHTEIRRAESFDLTTLSVGLRQLRNLTLVAAD